MRLTVKSFFRATNRLPAAHRAACRLDTVSTPTMASSGVAGIPTSSLAGIKGSIVGATTGLFASDIMNEFNPSVQLHVSFGGTHAPMGTELEADIVSAACSPLRTGSASPSPATTAAALPCRLLQTKAAPTVTVTSGGDASKGYGLLMFDPDAPAPDNPSKRNWLHWIVCNARPDNIKAGNVVMEYAPPTPPKGTHRSAAAAPAA